MTLRTYQIQTFILLLALLVLTFPLVTSAAGYIASTVWSIVVAFFGFFVGLAGSMLDVAIANYVIGFGNSFITSGVGVAVDTLWIAIRDIFNLTFIFGLVIIGLKMILGSDDSGTKRWLVRLILAALLVNFSLYITKFIVDFTNIMATEVAQAFPLDNNNKISISFGFMNSLGITTLLAFEAPPGDSPWAHIFGSAILFLVMIFTFAAGAFLLLIRYAVLSLYMVFSPLMFLGWVFPQMQSYTSKYWSGFLGRAFFAPIYLLLVYFSYYVVATIYAWNNNNNMAPDFADVFKANPTTQGSVTQSVEGTLMTFFIACIFLIASIVIASMLGADGANAALKIGNNAKDWTKRQAGNMAGGATFGLAARGMRITVGQGSDMLTRSRRFREMAASSTLGKYAYKTAQKGAAASFDARQVGGLGKAAGIGTGVAGGYAKSVANKVKADKKFLDSIKTDVNTKDPKVRAKIQQRAEETLSAATIAEETNKAALSKNTTDHALAKKEHESKVASLSHNIEASKKELEDNEKSGGTLLTAKQVGERQQKLKSDQEELKKRNDDFKETDLTFKTILNQLQQKAEELQKQLDNAEGYAEAETKYANEIAYMNKLEKDVNFWNSMGSKLTGGAMGVTAGAKAGGVSSALFGTGAITTVGLSAAGVGMGYGTAKANADRANQSLKALREEYGMDGMKKAQKESKKQKMKDLAAAIAEEGETDKPAEDPKAEKTT